MKKDLTMYILVNENIKISKGKLAGQVGHAVNVYVYNQCFYSDMTGRDLIIEYMNGEIKKIILKASQNVLEELENRNLIAIRDKGFTHLEPNTLTCVNLGIHDKNNIPDEFSFIKELKLY